MNIKVELVGDIEKDENKVSGTFLVGDNVVVIKYENKNITFDNMEDENDIISDSDIEKTIKENKSKITQLLEV